MVAIFNRYVTDEHTYFFFNSSHNLVNLASFMTYHRVFDMLR